MKSSDTLFSFYMLFAMMLWALGWVALKVITPDVPFDVITFWRFVIMLIAFIPILWIFKIPFVFSKSSLGYIVLGSFLNIAFMVVSFFGVKYGTASAGSVVITTLSPLFTFFLVFLWKRDLVRDQAIGLLLGLVGGAIMMHIWNDDALFTGGNSYYLVAAVVWAFVTVLSQRAQLYIHPIYYSFFIALTATIVMFFATMHSDRSVVFDQGVLFWISIIFLGLFGQAIATTIFFVASARLGSQKASSFMFVVPLFALLFSVVLLNEPLDMAIVIGGTISLIAVYSINKRKRKIF